MITIAEKYRSALHKIRKTGLEIRGLCTGFSSLDIELGFRMAKGRFMVLSGVPGMGKSEFIDALVVNMAIAYGWKVMFFSPENNPEDEHITALVEKLAGKRIKDCTQVDVDNAIDFLNEHVSWICPKDKSIENLLNIAREQKDIQGLDWFIIDPWNYVTQNRSQAMLHEHLSSSLNLVTTFTREHDCLITIVAHPTNLKKDKNGITEIPDMYSISDGAQWRNKSDYGIIVHRADMSQDQMQVYLGKRKKKWMGKIGMVTLDYDPASGRFKGLFDKEYLLPNEVEAAF